MQTMVDNLYLDSIIIRDIKAWHFLYLTLEKGLEGDRADKGQ
jgi:hypothetical protein